MLHIEKFTGSELTLPSTVGNQTHSCGDCVLVKPGNDSGPDWKAQVHEVSHLNIVVALS